MAIHVREKPPLRHNIEAIAPSSRHYRWAQDESDPANVFGNLRHSSTMPGGHESLDCELPRKPGVDYADLERFTTLIVWCGLEKVGEYRLERAPRSSGDKLAINPSAVGWQAHLEDDKSALGLYVDREVSRWGEPPLWRKAELAAAAAGQGKMSAGTDSGGLLWDIPNEDIPSNEHSELWYEAPAGVKVAKLGYKGARAGAFTNFEAPTLWATDSAAAPGSYSSQALTLDDTVRSASLATARRRAFLRVVLSVGGTVPIGWQQRYSKLAVYGDHGLTTRALTGEPDGLLASDIVAHAVSGCPLLQFTAGADGTIRPSSFVLPHLAILELTTRGEIVRQATRYGLQDWAVWDDKTFYWHERGAFGRKWRARIGPSQLEETGPQVDRLWESIVVSYQDADGSTRLVGPPGSGADTESADLQDDDPENPATRLGIVRRDLLQMGTATAASATEVGRQFLEKTKLLDSSGQARFVGHVEDDRGVSHPYSHVRAGDQVSFVDAADSSYRRIVKADHSHANPPTCTVDLDAPPEGLAALLERLQVVLVPLGI